jgi:hypothetical protein
MDHPNDEILIDLLLDELSASEAELIRAHLDSCDQCSERARKLMSTLSLLDEYEDVQPSVSIKDRVLNELGLSEKVVIEVLPPVDVIRKRALRHRPILSLAAAAALVIFCAYIWQIFNPTRVMSNYGIQILNARLEAPSNIMPDAQAPVTFGLWDETNTTQPDQMEGLNVTFDLASDKGTVLSESAVTESGGKLRKEINFRNVEPGDYTLRASVAGEELISTPVKIKASYDINADFDRPIYRPGEEIRARVQVRTPGGNAVADKDVVFVLRSPLDSLVTQKTSTLNEFGVASFTYPLADIVPLGEYLATVKIDDSEIQKKIFVDDYKLPEFRIKLDSDDGYISNQKVFRGKVKVEYFYGKPVSDSETLVEWYTVDNGILNQRFSIRGNTNNAGEFSFAIDTSSLLADSASLENEVLESYFSITVKDSVDREENQVKYLPCSKNPVLVRMFPENGQIITATENRIYVLITDPTGEPVSCDVDILAGTKHYTGKTSDSGVFKFDYYPENRIESAHVTVNMAGINTVNTITELSVSPKTYPFIVRSLKSEYGYGEDLKIELMTPGSLDASVNLDLYKDDTWIAANQVVIKNAITNVEWKIPPVSGELKIEASLNRGSKELARDRTRILVRENEDLKINLSLDQKSYAPGSGVKADVKVESSGESDQASLGVVAADSSLIVAGEKAEASSKFVSDSITGNLDSVLFQKSQAAKGADKEDLTNALLNSRSMLDKDTKTANNVNYRIIPDKVLAKSFEINAIGNYPFIVIRSVLIGMLYLSIILVIISAIFSFRDRRYHKLPLHSETLKAIKDFTMLASINLILYAIAIIYPNLVILLLGFLFTFGTILRLVRCFRKDEIIADIKSLAFIMFSGFMIIASLLIAHQGIWKPVLKSFGRLHPILDTPCISLLIIIGALMIFSLQFIPSKGGARK